MNANISGDDEEAGLVIPVALQELRALNWLRLQHYGFRTRLALASIKFDTDWRYSSYLGNSRKHRCSRSYTLRTPGHELRQKHTVDVNTA